MITDIFSHRQTAPRNAPLRTAQNRPAHVTGCDFPDSFWHSLFLYNVSRITITSGLIILAWSFHFTSLDSQHHMLFFLVASLHLLLSGLFMLLIKLRKPDFNWQLIQHVCTDVLLICIMIYASGGLKSGLGILLMISLAGAGLISRRKMALFFAAIATIGILLQEIYVFLYIDAHIPQFTHAALLSMGYFIVTWLAHQLAARVIASEKLAHERGIDLANMAQINQLIIQDLQEGILVVDKNGFIRQCNTYAEKLIGLISHPHYFKPLRLSECAPALASRLSGWRSNTGISFDLLRLSRSHAQVKTRFVPIENSLHADVIIYLEDTSRIQSQIQQLKLAALGRLTANIAHEIRNPLSSISHAAELLEEDKRVTGVAGNRRLLRIIRDNTQRLDKIVQDVLQLNRRDTGETESIDIRSFTHAFINDFCLTEKIDNAVFQLQGTDTCPIRFDRIHLHQILWNLCRNAWRYCRRQKGSITIQFSRCSGTKSVLMDIRDDGPGVTADHLKHLFEPFFTTAANGTGLGLYIARELSEANHASLEYINSSGGGHFRVTCKGVNHHV